MSDEEIDDEWLNSYKMLENDYNDFLKLVKETFNETNQFYTTKQEQFKVSQMELQFYQKESWIHTRNMYG